MTQKYNLNNHGKKASNSTKEVTVVTATLSEIGFETSLLMPKSVSAYSPTEFALEGPSESSHELNEFGINIVVEPGLKKTEFFEEKKTASGIKSSQAYPFAHFTETAKKRFRALMNDSSSLNLVAEATLNTVSSENRELRYLVGDYPEEIVKVRATGTTTTTATTIHLRSKE
ncbi:MAG: hypothetical protein WA395_07385 [Nitrososphaeraceae archaeon]